MGGYRCNGIAGVGVSLRGTRSHIRGNHHGYRRHFINTCIKKMSNQVSEDGARRLKRIGFLFNMVFIAEGLLIGIAIAICNLINQTDLIPGVIAIIVGIHFLPLASLFQIKVYYATGVLLCLLALITWLIVPGTVMIGEHQILVPLSLLGFGCALILWTTGLTLWLGIKNSSRTIADEE